MGMNAMAKLAYGIDLGEDGATFLQVDGDDAPSMEWDDFVARRSGLVEPEGEDYTKGAWSGYWVLKRKAVEAFPLTLVIHSSYDYSCQTLAVNGTLQQVDWGGALKLKPLEVTPERVQALKDFCAEHGIEGEPAWLLMAMYG